jgi:hypothetical protein
MNRLSPWRRDAWEAESTLGEDDGEEGVGGTLGGGD